MIPSGSECSNRKAIILDIFIWITVFISGKLDTSFNKTKLLRSIPSREAPLSTANRLLGL